MAIVSRRIDIIGDGSISIGMPTDGMSSPKFSWFRWPPFANGHLAECVEHDHKCLKAKALPEGDERDAARLAADRRFREAVLKNGASPWTAFKLYAAVRLGYRKTRHDPQIPDYEEDLAAAYEAIGIYDEIVKAELLPLIHCVSYKIV